MQTLTINMLGITLQSPAVQNDPVYTLVRIGWQERGQPSQFIKQDVAYVRCVEVDDPYNRQRDVQIIPNPNVTYDGGVSGLTLANGGQNYIVGDLLALPQGDGECQIQVNSVNGGAIVTLSIINPGANYVVANNLAATGGSGTGATFNVTSISNPQPTSVLQVTTYQRVWRTFFELYGPNACDRERIIHSALFTQVVHDTFAALNLNLYWVPNSPCPQRVPYFSDGEWWSFYSFYADFNEGVSETLVIPLAESVPVQIYTSQIGETADFVVPLQGD
jgi:hypothetical protein